MVMREDIKALARQRLNLVLLAAETALPPDNFRAYRKLVLGQFGRDGFEADLDALFQGHASGPARIG